VALNADLMPASKPAFSGKLLHEVLTNGAIFLLVGTFIIGWIIGQPGLEKLEGFVVTPFQGVLCLFLLDMGLVVARNLGQLRQFTLSLVAFGLYMPLIGAAVGLAMARLIGLDLGTGTLFAVLCASASYIAVPAAMRMALPEAKAAIYLPMSLAITFPFNIVAGIPLYYAGAKALLG
ncbi:MAG: sodium-dependent bicarbonate transport family permease, partial [Asticcacaulis sp.]